MSKTSIINLPRDRVSKINEEAPRGSKWFYVTPKRKVSYYKQLSSGHIACFNKGTNLWDATSLKEESLRLLPALCFEDFPNENLEEQINIDLLNVVNTNNEEGTVTVTGYNTNGFINLAKSNLPVLEQHITKANLIVQKEEKEESFSDKLKNLFIKHLPNTSYEVGNYVPGEHNYYVIVHPQNNTYTFTTEDFNFYRLGTIYTTSLRCIKAVVDELNLNQTQE